jgi:hypothetical protein
MYALKCTLFRETSPVLRHGSVADPRITLITQSRPTEVLLFVDSSSCRLEAELKMPTNQASEWQSFDQREMT